MEYRVLTHLDIPKPKIEIIIRVTTIAQTET